MNTRVTHFMIGEDKVTFVTDKEFTYDDLLVAARQRDKGRIIAQAVKLGDDRATIYYKDGSYSTYERTKEPADEQ